MTNFTPIEALIGGAFIGIATSLFLFLNGKIFGISGIVSGLFKERSLWRILVVFGLILGTTTAHILLQTPTTITTVPLPFLIIGGLLVGIGTKLGSGCTSGHGVCGNSRLSPRSMAATLTFMLSGFVAAAILNALGII
ncbi:MAG: YeeE/YedE thiosulfate transporter family protein [Bdellovibrionota bacterium]|nr:YeeE/YedE thiosulfate transporter family protein [Bdellovibrionota bacterium]